MDSARALRHSFGGFSTGVAVVTWKDLRGVDMGLTINSFASLSLEPPLISWALGVRSPYCAYFRRHGAFVVNVLSAAQTYLSERFARVESADTHPFADLGCARTPDGMLLLPETVAQFACNTEICQTVGDHDLIVARVVWHCRFNRTPLVFFGGRYGSWIADQQGVV